MRITLQGAAGGEVTGSGYLVQTKSANVLVDYGMFQGSRTTERHNELPLGLDVGALDAVVLTHGHLDHTGRLPLLTRHGYGGPIYATPATIDMASLIVRDSARLQEADIERENRHRKRDGEPLAEPLYTTEDAERVRPLTRALPYEELVDVAPGVAVRMVESGHMLGSASIEMAIEEEGKRRVVVFSGDLGPRGSPLLRDPVPFKHADLVFMESTYGDRDHPSLRETAIEGREVIRKTIEARGKVLVPVFAVGRTQMLLYLLAGAFNRGTLAPFPIYVDSPMAIEATEIYRRHVELFDEEALAMQQSGELRENLETVTMCPTSNDSRALNSVEGPCLIMAGAGMCNGGRILHHLRHNLANPSTTVLIVGFQSRGSLGRMLVDGSDTVRIFGESIPVRASVHNMGGFSAHAGQTDLLHWFDTLAPSRPRVHLVHGEDRGREALGRIIQERYQLAVEYPNLGQAVEV
jgi:metallo-beta-lactamase family protein